MQLKRPLILGLAALTLLAAACGDSGTEATPTATSTPDSSAAGGTMLANGPGLSITEAMTTTAENPLLVNGYVVVTAEGARFCESLAESSPPQCGGPSLALEGLNLDNHPEYTRDGDTTWSERVQLLGTLEGDTFTADEALLAAS